MRDAIRTLGIKIRVGLHTGEVETVGEHLVGIAVHTGARVAAAAQPSEVLVSRTVADLVAGSGIPFRTEGSTCSRASRATGSCTRSTDDRRGTLADARRLARQAQVIEAATSAFLSRIGLAPGWASLDVGCGDGQVTISIARIVGPRGRAVSVDADAEALGIAREAAMRAGVRAEFVRADASRPAEAETLGARISHSVAPATGARPRRRAWFLAVSETT
jgi:hypothetical protein